jgi:branched-chain amino acid transport system permease protein
MAQVMNGLSNSVIYAALALALVLGYRATGVINFAQGAMALFTTYVGWQFHSWGIATLGVIALVLVFGCALGSAIEVGIMERVKHDNVWGLIMLSFGLFLVFSKLPSTIWGFQPLALDIFDWKLRLELGSLLLTGNDFIAWAVLAGEGLFIWVLFKRTKVGLAMRSSVSDRMAATLAGVNVRSMAIIGWGLGGMFGGIAGILAAQRLTLGPGLMFGPLIYALSAMALGGLDSPGGAILGSIIVGVAESIGSSYIPAVSGDLAIAIPLSILLIVLLARPQGLFGSKELIRV